MTKKCHNYTVQSNTKHHDEETQLFNTLTDTRHQEDN